MTEEEYDRVRRDLDKLQQRGYIAAISEDRSNKNIRLSVVGPPSEEVEKIRVSQNQVRGKAILIPQGGQLRARKFGGLSGQRSPLVEHAPNLGSQGANAPSLHST